MNLLTLLYAYFLACFRKKWSRKKIYRHQKKRLGYIIKYAKSNSPYYKKLYGEKKTISDLPSISKEEMMENFSSFNTIDLSKEKAFKFALEDEKTRSFDSRYKDISIGLSSGTSGNRGIFLASKKERSLWAGNILAKTLFASLFRKTSIGLFLRANNGLYETLNSKKISFFYFDLQKPFERLFEEVEKIQPEILVAPPSLLRMLVENNLSYIPKKIISCAETLDPIDEVFLSSYFKKKIHQIYQCTEGFLATTCTHGTLHINEDLIFLEKEYIDQKSNRFIPIITDLYRTTQPIIRYRLNDILIEKDTPCPCGSHFLALEKVEGRSDDILYFKSKKGGLESLFPDFVRRQIILFDENITDYQVIQHSPDQIDLYINPATKINALISHLQTYFDKQGVIAPKIIPLSRPIERKQQDKKRRILRRFDV